MCNIIHYSLYRKNRKTIGIRAWKRKRERAERASNERTKMRTRDRGKRQKLHAREPRISRGRERQLFVTVSGLSRSIISRKVLLTALIFCPPFLSLSLSSVFLFPLLFLHTHLIPVRVFPWYIYIHTYIHRETVYTPRPAPMSLFFLQSLIVMLVHFGLD